MRPVRFLFTLLMVVSFTASAIWSSPVARDTRVVDRIVAHIEGDIILESQVHELAAFQQLIEGKAEGDGQLLSELIEQWIVQNEASASHSPDPAQSELDRELTRLTARFASPAAYAARLNELGLSAAQVRDMLSRQIYVERYLDYKFRPDVDVEPSDIDAYYEKELLPELAKTKQPVPSQAQVQDQIRELLVQRGISNLTAKWLDDTKSRLKIDLTPSGSNP